MADRFSVVEIDGRKYEIYYDGNAICDAEQQTGCNLLDATERLLGQGSLSMQQLRGLLFAMITPCIGFPKEPADQLKFCGSLIRVDTVGPITEALGHACALAVSQEYGDKFRAAMERAQQARDEVEAAELMMAQQAKEDPEKAAVHEAAGEVL